MQGYYFLLALITVSFGICIFYYANETMIKPNGDFVPDQWLWFLNTTGMTALMLGFLALYFIAQKECDTCVK
jgi:hypothetical protein